MSYGQRLEAAIKLANSSRAEVAKAAGITVQAVGQCIRGETEFLKVDGSAKAAALLDVDHLWLATGEGNPRPDRAWPFTLILPHQYRQLDAEFKRHLENDIAGEWMRVQQANGTLR
nr:helix-turn-helix transcriptional regulator [uncultured Rhodoferax sp.]